MMKLLFGALLCTLSCWTTAAWADAPGQACHLPGHEAPLRCLMLDVPKDYAHPEKGTLKLHVTVASALREGVRSDPLFLLAGGPGQSGSSVIGVIDTGLRNVRATRDIVVIDQRGTGKSGKLYCRDTERLEIHDPDLAEAEIVKCLKSIKVDFNDYSTEAAARDIDQVRQALHYKKINLFGASYGTRLAQAYARLFAPNLRAMVIDGVASPELNLVLMGSDNGRALELVRQQCEQDAKCHATFPHFADDLNALLARAKPGTEMIRFVDPLTGKSEQVPLRLEMLVGKIQSLLYVPSITATLPWLLMQAREGNWQPLFSTSFGFGNSDDQLAFGLFLAVVCAEDMPYATPEKIRAEQSTSFLGDSHAMKLARWCPLVSVKPHAPASTSMIDVPTLLTSGARDPVTPPSRALEAMSHMSHAQHLVAPNLGHGVLAHGCGPKLMRQFLDAPEAKLDGKCLSDIAAYPFVMSAAGAQP